LKFKNFSLKFIAACFLRLRLNHLMLDLELFISIDHAKGYELANEIESDFYE